MFISCPYLEDLECLLISSSHSIRHDATGATYILSAKESILTALNVANYLGIYQIPNLGGGLGKLTQTGCRTDLELCLSVRASIVGYTYLEAMIAAVNCEF